MSGNSRSRSFPRMEASDSLPEFREWIFFIPFPFPNFGNGFFSFPSRSRILGMDFFHSLPVPEFWEWDFFIPFPFPKFGNGFFYSLPVPEFREWAFSIPFPFPNFGNGLFQFPSRSRTLKSHSRSPLNTRHSGKSGQMAERQKNWPHAA